MLICAILLTTPLKEEWLTVYELIIRKKITACNFINCY